MDKLNEFQVLISLVLAMVVVPSACMVHAAVTDAQLKQKIEAEYPAINSADDWEKIQILREYSYKHTNYANNVSASSYYAGAANVDAVGSTKTLGDAYEWFDNDNGGVVCGGTANMCRYLFALYGYNTWYLGIGFYPQTPSGSNFTHAQTMVEIDFNGNSIRVVCDPSTNNSYTYPDGQTPIDYYEMLKLLAANNAAAVSYKGAVDGSGKNPRARTICLSDETNGRNPTDYLGSWVIDAADYDWVDLGGGIWRYESPRTVAGFENLGDYWWKQELPREGRPGETIYLHCFPFGVSGGPNSANILAMAKQIVADYTPVEDEYTITFSYGEGFRDNGTINAVAGQYNAQFSVTNGTFVGLYPEPVQSGQSSALYFNPDGSGNVAGRIDFAGAVTEIEMDITYFAGETATMTAYDKSGTEVASVSNAAHLAIAGTAAIKYVTLTGNSGSSAALNIDNVYMKIYESPVEEPTGDEYTIRFTYAEGFRNNSTINSVAVDYNAQFSVTNGKYIGLYPQPVPDDSINVAIYFQCDSAGDTEGRIDFAEAVRDIEMDLTYFGGGTATMTAYDESGSVIASASDVSRLAITGSDVPIKYVTLTGNSGNYAALNVDNIHMVIPGPPAGDCLGDLPGDLNLDCQIDLDDFELLCRGWHSDYDITDLAEMLGNWLDCNNSDTDLCFS